MGDCVCCQCEKNSDIASSICSIPLPLINSDDHHHLRRRQTISPDDDNNGRGGVLGHCYIDRWSNDDAT